MRKYLLIIACIVLLPIGLSGQGDIDEQTHVLFRDESTFGGFLHSNGFGLNYRRGYYRDARNQMLLDFDLNYVKHPKEVKTQVVYDFSTRRYVYGKENLFWELKAQAGWQKELFRKQDKGGISVRLFYEGGASLGFQKPIYYEVFTISSTGQITSSEYMKYNPSLHQSDIAGRGPFFMGFSEMKLVPGLTGKTGLSFEYSKKDAVIHALEAGILLTIYPREIPIMDSEQNNFFFFALNVGYRFGNIVDISEAARAKSRKERRKQRKSQNQDQITPIF